MSNTIINSLGRKLPQNVFGRILRPYNGIHNSTISGSRVGSPYQPKFISRKTKRFYDSLELLLDNLPLHDGMSISFHHALRNGDNVVLPIVEGLASKGIKNITLATTALFPVHTPLIEYIRSGIIGRIEGSVNGPLGNAISRGEVIVPCS